jgi:hypothetical protein
MSEPGVVIRIAPDRIRAWDFVDEHGAAPQSSDGARQEA